MRHRDTTGVNSDETTRALQAMSTLYELALGPERWPEALDAVAQLIGGNGALLFVNDGSQPELEVVAMSSRYKPMHTTQYVQSLAADDELQWVRVLDGLPPRTLQTDIDIWPDRSVYDAMPSVRFLRAMSLYHRVAVRPCAHGGWKDSLTIMFDADRDGITAQEARRLSLIVPHIARAIEMQRPFKLLHMRFKAVLSMLDRLGIGVLILAESGAIVASNEEAERVLAAGDGLTRAANGHPVISDADVGARFTAAIDRAARAARSGAGRERAQPALHVRRRSGAEPYVVDVVPLRDDGGELGSAFAGVLLVVIDPDHREMVAVDALVHSYGLTPAEAVVCASIAHGLSLREIAESRNVGLETIKTQSRAIYAKTQTRNRRELVRRALSIAPPLLDGNGRRIN